MTPSAEVDAWNKAYPVGELVAYEDDLHDVIIRRTRSRATVLSGHTAVIWLENMRGCYLLARVKPISVPDAVRHIIADVHHVPVRTIEPATLLEVDRLMLAGLTNLAREIERATGVEFAVGESDIWTTVQQVIDATERRLPAKQRGRAA